MATVILPFGDMTQGDERTVERVLIAWADRNVPLGVCDEAPYHLVEIACQDRQAIVTVHGNEAYFDGETEIMQASEYATARKIASIVQD